MTNAGEIAARVLGEVERTFGYPIADEALRGELLSTWTSDAADESPFEEIFGFFITGAVGWAAEGQSGPVPEAAANAASAARLGNPNEPAELTPETPELVARHFCGLLTIETTPMPRPARHWLADLNVPLRGDGAAPIYVWHTGTFPEGAVYASEVERQGVRKLIRQLAKAEVDEDQTALSRLATTLRDEHPRAFAHEYPALLKKNLLPAVLRKGPPPSTDFSDEAGARIWRAYRAFVPVGRVLIARAAASRAEKLTAAEAEALAALAAGQGDWPPALLAGLLGPALSGDRAAAEAAGAGILKRKAGVPLTERWARLVVEEKGPFAP